jgi:tRNA pseudouridine65 synthase
MKHISHHILGDTKHGRGEHNKFIRQEFDCNRMLLHAYELQIKHPRTNDMLIIKAPLDNIFSAIFNAFKWDDKIV